jgi:membrane fusion protein (multidrug efflux system)
MSARATESKPGDATVVNIPRAEKSAPRAEAPQTPPSPQAPQQAAAAPVAAPKKRGSRRLILMIVVPLVLVAAGAWFYLTGGRYEDTDNAYVNQAVVSLSPDVAGRITNVNVAENQSVKTGEVLFTIDPVPYQIALDQANAALAGARVNVQQLKVAYGTAQVQLKSAQATLAIQQATYDRQQALVSQAVASSSTLDAPKLALQQAQTAVDQATQQVAASVAALGGDPNIVVDKHPTVLAAQAQVEAAQRNLAQTKVVSPADGLVSNVSSLNAGQFVAGGTTIASLVETDGTWIEANFKETQLTDLAVGQPASVKVDAYSGTLECKVASLSAATGAQFSLIPPQNATGNWVKVVQRVPVRIECPNSPELGQLKTGLSATVTVDTGRTTLDKMLGK